ncbi:MULTISPECIES: hypothetical protein [Brevibacterium]|uniref:Uncharacterized protein n=2 Tax=Brevibacterium casei TaxID=33889 RepID=K9AKP0_9MICO|nr:hypothetical protein [Brevibacterium casei]NJE68228.1 hypothetical protein [Brevibacterium sp. LS14]SII85217.1 Uncharacterised protein [Mycobacteroides abscessus subsp. abscessus]EKU47873.1 hypothetical protein C272_06550 [Brevibacterium casei S18]KZE19015.1 hypothetical protein AVW13_12060 [Brevibacterium casei]MBE4694013.1 hypothetical protein [Brevibacterium casei]
MKRFLDFLTNSTAAVALAAIVVVGLVLFLIPPLHPFAWVIGIVVCLGAAAALLIFHGEWRRAQTQIDGLRQSLSTERGRLDAVGLTPVDEEVAQIPDETRAQRILTLLPDEGGLVQSLRLDATFGTLAVDELAPLHTFREEFAKSSFDNPRSHTAFMNLYRAAEALSIWVNEETRTLSDDDAKREIRPGDTREGGWREYTEARSRGESLGDRFVSARWEFKQTALELGLVA